MNLPNLLTLSRLLGIPVLMVLLLVTFPAHFQVATALFIVFSATDTLDGRLARAGGEVTELGKFLDPLADKLFILSVLIVLVQEDLLAAWFVVVIFAREMVITVLRSLSATQGRVISASPWGKTKTVTQVGAVILLILQRPYPVLEPIALAAIGIATAFTIGSGAEYLWRFRHVFGRVPETSPPADAPEAGTRSGLAAKTAGLELAERLGGAGRSLALAESCTGGMVAASVTDLAGSSSYFKGGVVAYSNDAKRDLLGVPDEVLRIQGAVSRECAEAMAEGARRRFGADLGASVTGIAGPGADGTDKAVGLTYVGVAGARGVRSRELRFGGDRAENRRQAVEETLRLLLDEIGEEGAP
ncbi:MAG: CDP-diacylglycerol--glycerol-3-phosphate 3-phosphatidyltransferase [Candidatus Dormibacteraceae bacterium]